MLSLTMASLETRRLDLFADQSRSSGCFYKTFPIRGSVNFQFRAEAFNVANHPTFNGVNTGIGPNDPDPGVVNSPADPRIMEIVMGGSRSNKIMVSHPMDELTQGGLFSPTHVLRRC